jgi:excisionase family DNA binding protein
MKSQPPPTNPPPPGPRTPPPPSGPKKAEALLPVAEVAALWRCTPQHIYNLIARRDLRSVQVGIGRAKTRIPESAVAEFVARRTSKARAA